MMYMYMWYEEHGKIICKKLANILKISIQKDFDKKWDYDVYI